MNNELKKLVSKLNWKVTEDEVNNIVDELGEESEKSRRGVRHYKVLINIVCKKVDEELNLEESEIKCKSFAIGGVGFTTPNIMVSGGAVYYRVVLTNTKIYIYAFDNFFKLLEKYEYNISEIKELKTAEAGQDGVIPYEGYGIVFNDGKYIALYSINKFAIKDLDNLKDALVFSGVEYRKLKTKKIATSYFAMTGIVILGVIIFFINKVL